ncbi:MAG: tRNA preQ1(34) S-adenosylmethionine ribosyltransferase-isomerase QueA, partial [Elusimicrobia bacterium CG06_land_8_20_14_3_00_38_11]
MNEQNLSDFDYDLPKEFIAKFPCEKRDESKLLVLHRDTGKIEHKIFRNVVDYFLEGDVLVINKTKVIPARLFGKKETGGKIEILILGYGDSKDVPALVKPLKNLKIGTRIFLHNDFCEVIGIENE